MEEVRLLGTRVSLEGLGNLPESSVSQSTGLTYKNGLEKKTHATREQESKSIDKIPDRLKEPDKNLENSHEKLHKRQWNANDPEKDAEKCRQTVGEAKAFEKTLEHQEKLRHQRPV